MRSGVCLTLEGIPGSTVEECADGMVRVAKNVQCMVDLKFNGIYLVARPDEEPSDVIMMYRRSAEVGR